MLNVLGISITFIPSVMLCGHCQLDYLAKKGIINYKFVPEHFLDNKIVEWADVFVFIRSDSDLEAYVSKIAKKAGILGIPAGFDIMPTGILPFLQRFGDILSKFAIFF